MLPFSFYWNQWLGRPQERTWARPAVPGKPVAPKCAPTRPAGGARPSARRCPGSPAVAAARGAGLAHHHFGQLRQGRHQPLPDPGGQPFAGRVLPPLAPVEVVVVALFVPRPDRRIDVLDVHPPTPSG